MKDQDRTTGGVKMLVVVVAILFVVVVFGFCGCWVIWWWGWAFFSWSLVWVCEVSKGLA